MKQWLWEIYSGLTWQGILTAIAIFLITFTLSLSIVSLVLVKLPADYFQEHNEHQFMKHRSRGTRMLARVGKNLLGVILVLVGILLSLPGVPGQGILTILLGVMLLDFPGRRRLERKIVCRPKVREAIDRLRRRFSKPPLELE